MSTNKIIQTISLTLLIMLICTTLFSFLFVLIFPKTSAQFLYKLGQVNLSSKLYYTDYNRSNDINSLALALDLSIENNDTGLIINYSKEFFNHNKYNDYIVQLNQKNAQSSLTPLIKSMLINEDNYYKNMYAKAMIKNNNVSLAFQLACENLNNTMVNVEDIGCYIFSLFLKSEHLSLFTHIFPNTSQSVGKTLEDYFYLLYDFYFEKVSLLDNENKPYFIALANRIITVAGNVNMVSQVVSEEINTEDVLNKAYLVNESLKGITGEV